MNINRLLGIYNKNSWKLNYSFSKNYLSTWELIPKTNIEINPGIENCLWFKPKGKLRSGWYLFGIRHFSENNFSIGTIKNGRYGFRNLGLCIQQDIDGEL